MRILLLFSILLFTCFSNAQVFQWAKSGIPANADKIAVDRIKNSYVAGPGFIAKYDTLGNLIWQQSITAQGIAVDSNSNLYALGNFGTVVTIGSYVFTADGSHANTYLAKFDSSGTVQWATRSYSNEDAHPDGITVDEKGNPIIIGRFLDSLYLDSFFLDAPETNQIFLAKYSPDGTCLWAKHIESWSFGGGAIGPKIKSDNLGNSYISGHFVNFAKMDSLIIDAYGGDYDQDIFLAKIDSSGKFLWGTNIGGYGGSWEERSGPIDVDPIGNTYVSGTFGSNTLYLDSITLTNNIPYDLPFTAKFDPNGNCQWAVHGGNVPICAGKDGFYMSWPNLLYKYDGNVNLQWIKTVTGAFGQGVAAVNNTLYVTGSFNGTVSFDAFTLSDTIQRMFIAKLSNPIPLIEANFLKDSAFLLPSSITEKQTECSELIISPCPANNSISVNFSSSQKDSCILKICNAYGQNIFLETVKEVSFPKQIDVGALPKGIYFVEILQEQNHFVKKFVLQ